MMTGSQTQTPAEKHVYTNIYILVQAHKHQPAHRDTEAFTHRSLYTQKSFYTQTFTHRTFYTQRLLRTDLFYTQMLLQTDAFTHKCFYTQLAFFFYTHLFLQRVSTGSAATHKEIQNPKREATYRSYLRVKTRPRHPQS